MKAKVDPQTISFSDDRVTIIDVGGSFCDFYHISSNQNCYRSESFPSPRDEASLSRLIIENIRLYQSSVIAVGLPGPVKRKSDYVYMPPLDYGLNVDIFKKKLDGTRAVILNDAVLNAIVQNIIYNNGDEKDGQILSLTIGTSLGSTLISCCNHNSIYTPIELAHVPIPKSLNLDWIGRDVKYFFENMNASSLFSATGIYLSCNKDKAPIPMARNDSILHYKDVYHIKKNISSISLDKLKSWLNSLQQFCFAIFPGIDLIYLKGGVITAFDSFDEQLADCLQSLSIIPIVQDNHHRLHNSIKILRAHLEAFF